MEHKTSIQFCIGVSDQLLYQRLVQLVTLWGTETCVHLEIHPADSGIPDETDILIFEFGSEHTSGTPWVPDRHMAVIALVENSRQAIASYRYHPTVLLYRNADYPKLSAALAQCLPVWSQGIRWLNLFYQREPVCVPLYQIQYVEAQGRNSRLQCASGMFEVNRSLGQIAELLPQPPFLRCQKSFLVHLSAVSRVQNGSLIMSGGQDIPISRKQVREIRRQVELWHRRLGIENSAGRLNRSDRKF